MPKNIAIKRRINELRDLLTRIENEADLGKYNTWNLVDDIEWKQVAIRKALWKEYKKGGK